MGETRIGQVRIRTSTDDPLAARMRGDAALRALDLEPPGMPARTILCIRSMTDPLPGAIDLRSAHAPRATEWERAARERIGDAWRSAVRAIDGAVPATANAVLFADRAELLACAAGDVLGRRAAWWWRDTIRGGLTFTHVVREWMRAPEYVPAALQLLARGNDALAFVRALDPQQATELTTNVLRAHALEPLARTIVQLVESATTPRRRTTALPPLLQSIVPELTTSVTPSTATIEQSIFAIVTLTLRRAPTFVRGDEFVHHLTQWLAPPSAPTTRQTDPAPATEPPRPHAVERESHEQHDRPVASHPPAIDPASKHTPSITPDAQPLAPPKHHAHERDTQTPILQTPPSQPATRNPQPPEHRHDAPIHSHHAGLFFLINLATALGFYDPYGREEPIPLDLWDFLALTGRALVPEIEEDDLWPLLRELSASEELPELDDEILARVRESLALVIEDEDAASFVIRRPGHIVLSPAHLDVTFNLAAHPIEIRIAGLDRDPGWIPAAGRHVDFHFE